jgi:hypothetical protein
MTRIVGETVVPPPPPASIARLSTVFVVDAENAVPAPNGSFNGTQAYPTLQAAFDAMVAQGQSLATFLIAPTGGASVGPLVVPVGTPKILTIAAMGDRTNATEAVMGALTLNVANGNVTLENMITGDLTGAMAGPLILRNTKIDGLCNVPNAVVGALEGTEIPNAPITCLALQVDHSPGLANNFVTSGASVTFDGESEKLYFNQFTVTLLPNGFQVSRWDDGAPTGTIAPDSAFTFALDNNRLIIQPGSLTAARIYKIQNTTGIPAGGMVDVWPQGVGDTVTIHDNADATIATIAGGSDPVRLFFFATGANYVLTGKQSLLE